LSFIRAKNFADL